MIVAIDGPAGSGKSTVARAVARREGFTYLDTGAMYRSVTRACLDRGVDLDDGDEVARVARQVDVSFAGSGDNARVLLDGADVTEAIRTPAVDRSVSQVSAYPAVREAMVARQRELGALGDVVAEGRDIGTVVFPEAQVKVFLTADATARAHRRAVQREGDGVSADEEREVLADIERRDEADSSRATSPLVAAPDARRIDSSELTADQVCDAIVSYIAEARTKDAAPAGPRREAGAPRLARLRPFGRNDFAAYHAHGMSEFPLPARAFFWLAVSLVGAFSRIMWPTRFEGDRELAGHVARGRGSVIVMNHTSMIEPVVLLCTLWWRHRIHLRPIYKSEFDTGPLMKWVFSRVGGIPVKRGKADLTAIRNAEHALERGECVLIFPEGTRVKSDEEEVTIHGGFSLIAYMAGTDVVPMAVVGARDRSPRGSRLSRPGRVFIRIGGPIGFGDLGVSGRKRQLAAMERVAMDRVYELRARLRSDHPGKM